MGNESASVAVDIFLSAVLETLKCALWCLSLQCNNILASSIYKLLLPTLQAGQTQTRLFSHLRLTETMYFRVRKFICIVYVTQKDIEETAQVVVDIIFYKDEK